MATVTLAAVKIAHVLLGWERGTTLVVCFVLCVGFSVLSGLWGVLVSEGQAGISAGRWWASTFPGLMVFLWALAFNLVGDGLRDILDPRTESKR